MNNLPDQIPKWMGTAGLGIAWGLTILCIVLKLCGIISWPWVWVAVWVWGPVAIMLVCGFVAAALVLTGVIKIGKKNDRTDTKSN